LISYWRWGRGAENEDPFDLRIPLERIKQKAKISDRMFKMLNGTYDPKKDAENEMLANANAGGLVIPMGGAGGEGSVESGSGYVRERAWRALEPTTWRRRRHQPDIAGVCVFNLATNPSMRVFASPTGSKRATSGSESATIGSTSRSKRVTSGSKALRAAQNALRARSKGAASRSKGATSGSKGFEPPHTRYLLSKRAPPSFTRRVWHSLRFPSPSCSHIVCGLASLARHQPVISHLASVALQVLGE